jgi:Tol biopolymer transport system component
MIWSPTRDELIFIPETDTIRMTAHLLSLEDQSIIPLYEVGLLDSWGFGVPLDWSPSGTEIAVVDGLAQQVLILSPEGALRQSFHIPMGFPVEIAWSPSGEHIAVSVSEDLLDAGDVSDMTLYILEIETGELTTVFHEEERMITLPDWSADGSCLVFTTLYEHPEGWLDVDSLWLHDLATGATEQLVVGWGTIR